MASKICPVCKVDLPADKYYLGSNGKPKGACKQCRSTRAKAIYDGEIEPQSNTKFTPAIRAQTVALRLEGLRFDEIAEKLGLAADSVRYICNTLEKVKKPEGVVLPRADKELLKRVQDCRLANPSWTLEDIGTFLNITRNQVKYLLANTGMSLTHDAVKAKMRAARAENAPARILQFHGLDNWVAVCNEQARSRGGVWVGPLVDFKTKSSYKCIKGHEFKVSLKHLLHNDTWCPKCPATYSNLEQKTEKLLGILKYDLPVLKNSKIKYRPDFNLETLGGQNLYLNADGLFSHSEYRKLDRRYHFNMRIAYENEGKRILQFYEDEIQKKSDIFVSMVKARLGLITRRIGARDLEVKHVSEPVAKMFLEANHLIGHASRCSFVSLQSPNGIVCMVIATRMIDGVLHIIRQAGPVNVVVQGGFQKLMKHLMDSFPSSKIRTIVDLRYADGHSYENLGFKKVKTFLNYQYTNGKVRLDKRKFRVPAGVDERAEAAKVGFYRLWDAGKAVYELERTSS